MITSMELSDKGMCSISPLQKFEISNCGPPLVFACQREHLIRHIEAVCFAGWADPDRRTSIPPRHSLTSKARGPTFRRNAIARTRSALALTFTARKLVERFFNKIKQCRRVTTRYDKLAANYLAFIKLASIRIWLRANESTAQPTALLRQ
jgi:transposase